jgi:hypothetical protein
VGVDGPYELIGTVNGARCEGKEPAILRATECPKIPRPTGVSKLT